MKRLVEGVREFRSDVFPEEKPLFEGLAAGQQPLALFITCADSRIDPNLLTQTKPGELFVLRTAGNIVPPYDAYLGGEAATIEYAVSALKVKDIVVCGHSRCGAMGGLLKPESLNALPAVKEYLTYAEDVRRTVESRYATVTDPAQRVAIAVEQNVLLQMENLKTHPTVAAALAENRVSLNGWVYKFETGEVFGYDPKQNRFAFIEDIDER
jgi:carbonic anhydrase